MTWSFHNAGYSTDYVPYGVGILGGHALVFGEHFWDLLRTAFAFFVHQAIGSYLVIGVTKIYGMNFFRGHPLKCYHLLGHCG